MCPPQQHKKMMMNLGFGVLKFLVVVMHEEKFPHTKKGEEQRTLMYPFLLFMKDISNLRNALELFNIQLYAWRISIINFFLHHSLRVSSFVSAFFSLLVLFFVLLHPLLLRPSSRDLRKKIKRRSKLRMAVCRFRLHSHHRQTTSSDD